jgi:hypothetical protein
VKLFLALATCLILVSGSYAQQPAAGGQPDPAFLQKAVQALQIQRNNEADQRAVAEARGAMLQDEVTKLQKELAEAKKVAPAETK